MSGIVGSKLNIRGSGRIAKLGTDGQVLTSSGAGEAAAFEDAAGGGKIGQVVQTLKTDSTTSASTTFVTSGFAVAITPVDVSSKVLLFINCGTLTAEYSGMMMHAKIDGGNCATYIGDTVGTAYESAISTMGTYDTYGQQPNSLMYLDSPATVSEVTYTMYWAASNGTIMLNNPYNLRADGSSGNTASTFIAMEI